MDFSKEINDEFKKLNVEILLYPSTSKKKFASFDQFSEFFESEKTKWSKCNRSLATEVLKDFAKIESELRQINTEQNTNFEAAIRRMNNAISLTKKNSYPLIFSSTKEGKLILDSWDKQGEEFVNGYMEFLFKPQITSVNMNNKNFLKGILLAYILHDSKKSIEGVENSINSVFQDLHDRYTEDISEQRIEYEKNKDEIIQSKEVFVTQLLEWQSNFQKNNTTFIEEKREEIKNLEKIYDEKLRLSKPSEYWEDFKKKYRWSALGWMIGSIVFGIGIILLCLYLINNMPDQLFNGDKLIVERTVKWGILLTLIFSSAFYLLRLFVKLAMSSFHLSRDANERLQLTHQFLALMKEGKIEKEQEIIILQSLFSRAETGLLKGDSSPAFPESLLSMIAKNFTK